MHGIEEYSDISSYTTNDEFIQEHSSLVRKIAFHIKKKLPKHIEVDDLLQSGYVGLIEAKKNYDPNIGTPFHIYASTRIKGAIIDSIRKNSWVSRGSIKFIQSMNAAISVIQQREGRDPKTEEIIKEMNTTEDDYNYHCQLINISNMITLDNIESAMSSANNDENPGAIHEKDELIDQLKKSLKLLPERDQLILTLYYVEEITFKEIGIILDLTEARICQLHGEAVIKLKRKLCSE